MKNLFRKPIVDPCTGASYLIAKKSATKEINKLPTIGRRDIWNTNTIWEGCVIKKIEDTQVYWNPKIEAYQEETDPRYFI